MFSLMWPLQSHFSPLVGSLAGSRLSLAGDILILMCRYARFGREDVDAASDDGLVKALAPHGASK
jgi:hypothetical protein